MALKEQALLLIEAQSSLKEELKTALTDKGVKVPDNARLKDYPKIVEGLEAKPPLVVSKSMPKNPVEGMIWVVAEPFMEDSSSSGDQESDSSSSPEIMDTTPLTFTAKSTNVTIKISTIGDPVIAGIRYRYKDTEEWTAYAPDEVLTLANIDDTLYLENTLEYLSTDDTNYAQFVIEGDVELSGNIQALVHYSYYVPYACYYRLFKGCTGILTAPSLPSKSLGFNCYANMFQGCTGLTTLPELPASSLLSGCYAGMFKDCTGITDLSSYNLPAEKMVTYCYQEMFSGCTNLVNPPELRAVKLADSCYNSMFYNCTNLTKAPELPATDLVDNCYDSMFEGCTSLTRTPTLRDIDTSIGSCIDMFRSCVNLKDASNVVIRNVASYSCQSMFYNCTNLTEVPELPATELAEYCYHSMFYGCTNLTKAPELPATELVEGCYYGIFASCTNLVNPPELPATELADNCYYGMFAGCTSITKAPELPAINMVNGCYRGMFYNCTNLTEVPELPATELADNCYQGMFENCNSLKSLTVSFLSWYTANDNLATEDWVKGITSTGDFHCLTELSAEYGDSFIPVNWETFEAEWPEALTFTALEANSVVTLSYHDINIEGLRYRIHSTNKSTDYVSGTQIVLKNAGDFVQFQNLKSNTLSSDHSHYVQFDVTGNVEVSGKITSLHNYTTEITPYCYYRLFDNCYGITSFLSDLPATELAESCYAYMFYNCTSLTKAPVINGMTLANNCYAYMFFGCSNLEYIKCGTIRPDVCSYWMLGAKESGTLETVEDSDLTVKGDNYILPGWYVMLDDGRPDQSDTDWYQPLTLTMPESAYVRITNIHFGLRVSYDKQAWETITTESWLSDLTRTLYIEGLYPLTNVKDDSLLHINVRKTTTYTDQAAFSISGNIHSLLGYAKNPPKLAFADLFRSSEITSVPKNLLHATKLSESCYQGMFEGCTNLAKAPELPATELANNCYRGMFYGCTSLTKAPELPATELAYYCYAYMFYHCTNLTEVPELPATELASHCYYSMFEGCTSAKGVLKLPATELVSGCYARMFYNAYYITPHVNFTSWDIDGQFQTATSSWLYGRAKENIPNTFIKPALLPTLVFDDTRTDDENYRTIPANAMVYNTGSDEYPDINDTEWYTSLSLLYNEFSSRKLSANFSPANSKDAVIVVEHYTDSSYATIKSSVAVTLYQSVNISKGDYIRLRAHNLTTRSGLSDVLPNLSGFLILGGNIQSLSDFCKTARRIFEKGYLAKAESITLSKLHATKLSESCYNSMFYNCTNLTEVPELPATALASHCYYSMFEGCTNLTKAPELPATTLAANCYDNMFLNCTGLTEAPKLPATTLADWCYFHMFEGCRSLTKAPELPATELAYGCYNSMFYNCTNLTKAPELPATDLVDRCYQEMFYGCTSLNYVSVYAKNWDGLLSSPTTDWLKGVSTVGEFHKPRQLPPLRDDSHIPVSWTVYDRED